MIGRSIYLSSSTESKQKCFDSIQKGDWVFVSLHSFEDFVDDFHIKAFELVDAITACGGQVVADVSPEGINRLGYQCLVDLAKSGRIDALRLDYGFTTDEMFEAAKHCKIVLNGSILDEDLIDNLQKNKIPMIGMHNFYPRVDSGLDEDYALECTRYLHEHGGQSWAFISGDGEKREPIFAGLPTIEDYRYLHPYVQYELLYRKLENDAIFVGDTSLKPQTEKLIRNAQTDDAVLLPLVDISCIPESFRDCTLTLRRDSNSKIGRVQESRMMAHPGQNVIADNCLERKPGDITLDNEKYLRYSGEIEIVRRPMKKDERVNVIGRIQNEFLPLLQVLKGSTKIRFIQGQRL